MINNRQHHQNLAIWDAATGSADPTATVAMSAGGTAGEVDVSIEELRRTARSFYGLQQQLADNMAWISRNLHANATGMAGADPVLAPWRNLYDDTVRALWRVLDAAADMLGGVAQGMTDTGNNYIASEEASVAGRAHGLPERLPQLPVDTVRPGPEPPPSGSEAPAQNLEDWGYEYWPDGDPERLVHASDEWRRLEIDVLDKISHSGDSLINGLTENNHGEVFDNIRRYWATQSQLCGTSELLPVLKSGCSALSSSCKQLATAVRNAHKSIAKLYQAVDDLDIFTAFPIAKKFDKFRLAQLGYELGKYMHIKVHMPKIKERYEFERNQAIDLLTNGADERLHQLAGIAGATTVESERQAYDRADHGLEQHLSSAPYDAWSAVDEPHYSRVRAHHPRAHGAHPRG